MTIDLDALKWDANGLVPVVIADARGGSVLTLAYANREAVERTLRERTTWLYSRSRSALWRKGETSGHTQEVLDVRADCDNDALLYLVNAHGPACHTGAQSCFGETAGDAGNFARALDHLRAVLAQRKSADPQTSYVAKLYAGGVDKIGKKIGEEATEVVIAAKNANRDEIRWEAADLLFHLMVMLEQTGVSLDDVGSELLSRIR